LQESYDESTLVSQAQGALMAIHQCSSAQAEELIRRASSHNGERLMNTAQRILSAVRDAAHADQLSSDANE
jgi:AmiR/NasT family two-component response regulator